MYVLNLSRKPVCEGSRTEFKKAASLPRLVGSGLVISLQNGRTKKKYSDDLLKKDLKSGGNRLFSQHDSLPGVRSVPNYDNTEFCLVSVSACWFLSSLPTPNRKHGSNQH